MSKMCDKGSPKPTPGHDIDSHEELIFKLYECTTKILEKLDKNLITFSTNLKEILEACKKVLELRDKSITSLEKIIKSLSETLKTVHKAKKAGAIISVATGSTYLVGLILTATTAGAAAPLVMAFGGIGMACGTATSIISNMTGNGAIENASEEVKDAIEKDAEATTLLAGYLKNLRNNRRGIEAFLRGPGQEFFEEANKYQHLLKDAALSESFDKIFNKEGKFSDYLKVLDFLSSDSLDLFKCLKETHFNRPLFLSVSISIQLLSVACGLGTVICDITTLGGEQAFIPTWGKVGAFCLVAANVGLSAYELAQLLKLKQTDTPKVVLKLDQLIADYKTQKTEIELYCKDLETALKKK